MLPHTTPGEHLDACPTPSTCTGCAPRPTLAAEPLLVCVHHRARVVSALAAAPDLVAHLRECVIPGKASTGDPTGTRSSSAAPAPLSVAAVSDADDVHAMLMSWALEVRRLHPSHPVPPMAGSDVRPQTSTRTADGAAVVVDAQVVGLTSTAPPETTTWVTRWLLDWLHWALCQPALAAALATEIPAVIGRIRARWPIEDRDAALAVPCPACDLRTLIRHVPRWASAPVTVTCSACTWVADEDRYDWLIRLAREAATRA